MRMGRKDCYTDYGSGLLTNKLEEPESLYHICHNPKGWYIDYASALLIVVCKTTSQTNKLEEPESFDHVCHNSRSQQL